MSKENDSEFDGQNSLAIVPSNTGITVTEKSDALPFPDSSIVNQARKRLLERKKREHENYLSGTKSAHADLEQANAQIESKLATCRKALDDALEDQKAALTALDQANLVYEKNVQEIQKGTDNYDRDNAREIQDFIKNPKTFAQFAVKYLTENREMLISKIYEVFVGSGRLEAPNEEIAAFIFNHFVLPAISEQIVFEGDLRFDSPERRTALANFAHNTLRHLFDGKNMGQEGEAVRQELSSTAPKTGKMSLTFFITHIHDRAGKDGFGYLVKRNSDVNAKFNAAMDNFGYYVFQGLKRRDFINDNAGLTSEVEISRTISEMAAMLSGIEPDDCNVVNESWEIVSDCKNKLKNAENRIVKIQESIRELKEMKLQFEEGLQVRLKQLDNNEQTLQLPDIKNKFARLGEQLQTFLMRRVVQLDVQIATALEEKIPVEASNRHELDVIRFMLEELLNDTQRKHFYKEWEKSYKAPLRKKWYEFGDMETKRSFLKYYEQQKTEPAIEGFYSMLLYIKNIFSVGKQYYQSGAEVQKQYGEILMEIANIYAEKAVEVATEIEVKLAVPDFSIADFRRHVEGLALLMDGRAAQQIMASSAEVDQEIKLLQEAKTEAIKAMSASGQIEDFDKRLLQGIDSNTSTAGNRPADKN